MKQMVSPDVRLNRASVMLLIGLEFLQLAIIITLLIQYSGTSPQHVLDAVEISNDSRFRQHEIMSEKIETILSELNEHRARVELQRAEEDKE